MYGNQGVRPPPLLFDPECGVVPRLRNHQAFVQHNSGVRRPDGPLTIRRDLFNRPPHHFDQTMMQNLHRAYNNTDQLPPIDPGTYLEQGFDEQRGNPWTYHGCITYASSNQPATVERNVSRKFPRNSVWRGNSKIRSPRSAKLFKTGNERDADFGEDLTVTIQCKPSKEPVERQDNSFFVTGTVFCQTCNVSFAEKTEYSEHLKSASHIEQYNLFCKLHQKKTEHLAAKCESPENLLSSKLSSLTTTNSGKVSFCKTCKSQYQGDVVKHRQSSSHKANKVLIKPYCTQCSMFLRSPAKFILHCNSPTHHANRNKRTERMVEALAEPKVTNSPKRLVIASVEEPKNIVRVEKKTDVESGNVQRDDGIHVSNTEVDTFCEFQKVKESVFCDLDNTSLLTQSSTSVANESPRKPIGTSSVMAIKGFYCTVCCKLFTDKYYAKILHCQSKLHHDNFKAKKNSRQTGEWQMSSLIGTRVELVNGGEDEDNIN